MSFTNLLKSTAGMASSAKTHYGDIERMFQGYPHNPYMSSQPSDVYDAAYYPGYMWAYDNVNFLYIHGMVKFFLFYLQSKQSSWVRTEIWSIIARWLWVKSYYFLSRYSVDLTAPVGMIMVMEVEVISITNRLTTRTRKFIRMDTHNLVIKAKVIRRPCLLLHCWHSYFFSISFKVV